MSKDIRSFFNVEKKQRSKPKPASPKLNKRRVIDSDDDEENSFTSKQKKVKKEDTFEAVDISDVYRNSSNQGTLEGTVIKNKKLTQVITSESCADEERYEKKRMAAVLYEKFKNRSGPRNPGSKEIPQGKPNCFAGITFLITGVLDSLDRDEVSTIIENHGGKVVKSVSKKLGYIIVGEDAGPAKLSKAEELNIKMLSEDDLLKLIRDKSDMPDESDLKPALKTKNNPSTEPKKTIQSHLKTEGPDIQKQTKQNGEPSHNSKLYDKTMNIKVDLDSSTLAWVDKYKPSSLKQIIGQQGPSSNCVKLLKWLSNWKSNQHSKNKSKKPNPWAKSDDGAYYKAALLSGPPGVGKTTTATLVCKELGYDFVEFNASDTRNKKLLKEEVSTVLSNQSLSEYAKGRKVDNKERVVIMDEVDGMAGNEDRGGISELIQLIKISRVPIICMCNDRSNQKIRSLVPHCFDLRFVKPKLEQIKGAMMSICFKEKLSLPAGALDEIIDSTGNDIRQTLNYLTLFAAHNGNTNIETTKGETKCSKKDIKIGHWDVIRKVFSAEEHKDMTLNDKANLFFFDYNLSSLFVHENYYNITPKSSKMNQLNLFASTADSLSFGDMVEKRIRSNNSWSLLPIQAIYSSVLPGFYLEGNFTKPINFPAWLGKNSKSSKRKRLAQEVHDHTRCSTSGPRLSLRLDYAPFLINAILNPLKMQPAPDINASISIMKQYKLLREDIDGLLELTTWPKQKSIMTQIDAKVKSALTRTFNKEILPYSYSIHSTVKKKKSESEPSLCDAYQEDDGEDLTDDENQEDDIHQNAFIKIKKSQVKSASRNEKIKHKK